MPKLRCVTAAQGAWLVSMSFSGAEKGPSRHGAFETYDGLTTPRGLVSNADHDAEAQLIYELPALTTFDRFAVPDILEVPSAYVTFFREVEVWGSASGAGEDFQQLAAATLEAHRRRGMVTDMALAARKPVRFLKLVLRGGIDNGADKM